jgi:hypothetical protein
MRRSRSVPFAVAASLGLVLTGITAPAFALGPIDVATPTGTDVAVTAELDTVDVTATFSEVFVAGDTYFETYPVGDYDLTGLGTVDTVYGISSSADWTDGELEVCISYNPDAVVGTPTIRSHTWNATTEAFEWIDRTTPSAAGTACGVDPWSEYSGQYVLEYNPDPDFVPPVPVVTTPYVPVVTADYAIDVVAGYLDSEWLDGAGPILTLTIENLSDADLTIGLGLDLAVDGEFDRLWQPATWPGTDTDGIAGIFTFTLSSGEVWDGETEEGSIGSGATGVVIPEWQGKSYAFYRLTGPDRGTDDGELIAVYDSPGRFVSTLITVDEAGVTSFSIGSEAFVSGVGPAPELFPGVEATVTADELTPGDEYELWLAPGLDYFWFYLIGAELPDDAVAVGTGVVDSAGVLSANFEIPSTTPLGRYQLIVGIPDERFWPAGSYSSFTVSFPDDSGQGDIVQSESSVTVELDFNTVAFTFPDPLASDAVVTASVSTTGPTPDSTFVLGTYPSQYFHLDTTASFDGFVEVCITYDPLLVSGGIPYLYHYATQPDGTRRWQNISTVRTEGLVCGLTDSFSPFTLGYPVRGKLTTISQCLSGGWATSTSPLFRNQGACVAYFVSKRQAI